MTAIVMVLHGSLAWHINSPMFCIPVEKKGKNFLLPVEVLYCIDHVDIEENIHLVEKEK